MARLSLWDSGAKGDDYKFIDSIISEFFGIGGTAAYLHLYIGPTAQDYQMLDTANNSTSVVPANTEGTATTIQDVLLLENRDRTYSKNVYEMRTIYTVADQDWDLRQFGLFIQNDVLYLEFHLSDMLAQLGRKIMPGDVVELPHRRDSLLDPNSPSINKFYVVADANRASDGYSATWYPHIWRIKVEPMPASQEYQDILNQEATNPLGLDQGSTIGDLMSTGNTDLGINEAVVDNAKLEVSRRFFDTRQFYIVPGDQTGKQNPWIFAGDGVPPNGATLLGSGTSYPDSPATGEYYLRTDYSPPALFMWNGNYWAIQEQEWRNDWSAASRLMREFITDDTTVTHEDGTVAPRKINLSKAVKPRADF